MKKINKKLLQFLPRLKHVGFLATIYREHAGQTIPHLHIHMIPRYIGDCGLPCGVRNVFPPNLANYRK